MTAPRPYEPDQAAVDWARGVVEKLAAKYRKWEQEANAKGETEQAARWHRMANMLELELVGGQGCVITPFDARRPDFIRTLNAETGDDLVASDTFEVDPEVLAQVVLYHSRSSIRGCDGCGWAELGKSHAEHVVTVARQAMADRDTADDIRRHAETRRRILRLRSTMTDAEFTTRLALFDRTGR